MEEIQLRQPTFIDLFSGCGGASLGFLNAGYRCLLAIDYDGAAVKCYNDNLRGPLDGGCVEYDLSQLSTHDAVRSFLASQGIAPGSCDVLVGGPPCQSFSIVGRTKIRALSRADENAKERWLVTDRERTGLFSVYATFLEVLAPRWFFFENVPAIKRHAVYSEIRHRFENLSDRGKPLRYQLAPDLYFASDYGVPQKRRRFIMVGHRKRKGIKQWFPPSHRAPVTVSEAVDDLPPVRSGERPVPFSHRSAASSDYQALMRLPAWWMPVGPDAVRNHVCRNHNPDDLAVFERMAPGDRFADEHVYRLIESVNSDHKLLKYSRNSFKDKLHKLKPDEPAWTVTAHLQKDCYKFIHHSQPRTISVREAARFQSFPDWFVFPDALGHAFRMIGNAVPPLLAEAFARSFRSSDPMLAEVSRASCPARNAA